MCAEGRVPWLLLRRHIVVDTAVVHLAFVRHTVAIAAVHVCVQSGQVYAVLDASLPNQALSVHICVQFAQVYAKVDR
jgi:hypothetical protein